MHSVMNMCAMLHKAILGQPSSETQYQRKKLTKIWIPRYRKSISFRTPELISKHTLLIYIYQYRFSLNLHFSPKCI